MNTNHPWIGLAGLVHVYPFSGDNAGTNDYHGVVIFIGQGGSAAEDGGCAYTSASVLRDVPDASGGVYGECDLCNFVPDNPAEARRRLEAAGAPTLTVNAPTPNYGAIGRGMMMELLGSFGADTTIIAARYLCQIIGREIGAARGGGS